jgi:hypothetical protein
MKQQEIKQLIQKRREKNEASMRLTNLKKLYTRSKQGIGSQTASMNEKI